jgi:hypothetical protein
MPDTDPRLGKLTDAERARAERPEMRAMSVDAQIRHFRTERRVARFVTIFSAGSRITLMFFGGATAIGFGFGESVFGIERAAAVVLGAALCGLAIFFARGLRRRLDVIGSWRELK